MDLFNNTKLSWQDYGPDERFSYPIGYGGASLGHDGRGHIDLVYRWEPGKKADLVVLDRDPYLNDPYAIHSIEVDLTLSNGRLAYKKQTVTNHTSLEP